MAVTLSSKGDIPLSLVDSTTSSKYPPSYHTQDTLARELDQLETASEIDSSSSPFPSISKFTPITSLQIQSIGKSPISVPSPAKQLETPIFSLDTGRPVYLSIRPSRSKGDCRLVHTNTEDEPTVAQTKYFFGPGRSPQIQVGVAGDIDADAFNMDGKSLLTRAVVFKSRKWGRFEWRYARKSERAEVGENINNLLVLEKITPVEGGKEKEERIRVAQLVRSEETRTPGTRARYAGNGGRLDLNLTIGKGEKGQWIDEVTVVATCLVMLKKEVDRLRTTQIMIMSGAASGGS